MLKLLAVAVLAVVVTAQQGTSPQICELDVALAIDASGSIWADQAVFAQGEANWNAVRNFAADLVQSFTSGVETNHVAAVKFEDAGDTSIIFNLGQKTPVDMVNDLRNLAYDMRGGRTRMDVAAELIDTQVFVADGVADRFDAADVVIIITDGRITQGFEADTLRHLQALKDRGVGVIAVGVTDQVDNAQLAEIASCANNCVFTVQQFNELASLLETIKDQACVVIQPTTTTAAPSTCPAHDPFAIAFSAYSSPDGMMSIIPGMVIPFHRTVLNIGGHFDTIQYRFTCPCTGIYEFHLTMSYVSGGVAAAIVLNGAVVSPLAYQEHRGAMSTTTIIQCNAGGQVYAQIINANGGFIPCLFDGNSFYGFTGKFIAAYN